jgi:hypothetical protein
LPAAAAAVASLLPPAPPSLFAHSRWLTHQCRITPGSRRSRTLVHSWLALLTSGELREWKEKRGGFWQHVTHRQLQCAYEDDRRVKLLAGTGQLGRALLAELGVDSSEATLQLGDVKVLRTSCGQGQQEIHFDIPHYDNAGDALVLNCAVPHWGVNNPDEADRYVVFASFSPRSLPPPDTEDQRYPLKVTP